jgi:hypothetical protein
LATRFLQVSILACGRSYSGSRSDEHYNHTRKERSRPFADTTQPEGMRDVLAGCDPGPFNEKLDAMETENLVV